jgi:PII-like signaling protein
VRKGVFAAAGLVAASWAGAGGAASASDLVLTSVKTNRVSLAGKPFYVTVTVTDRASAARKATITIASVGGPLAVRKVTFRPRRRTSVKLPVTLPTSGRIPLTVSVTGTKPRRVTVQVAEFRVRAGAQVVTGLAGYGGQFNHHVYAALSRSVGVTDENVVDMEQKMRALHPQFSRVFFTPQAFSDPDKMQTFVRTMVFAQGPGTTINVTWQGGTLSVASGTVQKFANVLIDLVRNRGVTNLRWLTLQNEPNRTRMAMQQYETQYRELDPYIQSIRGQVRYMGGDLVRGPDVGAPNQDVWFQYLAAHMSDLLDAYSIHVFWDYWDTQKLVYRLTEVRKIVDALPESGRKPVYVTEYGVRGLRTLNGATQVDPGVWEDGAPITQTNVSAFQQAWFDVLSADLGYLGTSKWDSYYGKYDNGTQAYYIIGAPQSGWPLYPLYNFMQLLTTTVKRDWSVVAVDSVPGTSRLLAGYLGKKDQLTVVGLDTAGAQLNALSPTAVSYAIAGLPPSKPVNLLIWNQSGDGLVAPRQAVTIDAAGVATITVPQQAVFVLTTIRLG